MEINFHGGAGEVGRSCIELICSRGHRYLFDVGLKLHHDGVEFPENVKDIKNFDGVFLSHAHLDHSGGLPLFEHRHLSGPIFCTRQTFGISKLMLQDSYKIAKIKNLHPEYNGGDLKKLKNDVKLVDFDTWYVHKSLRYKFLNSGHVPGSAMILIHVDGKTLLYSADFNDQKSLLMFPLSFSDELKDLDVLISESTYGAKELPDRARVQKDFRSSLKKTLQEGGSALLPVFALGRAQEALILLADMDIDVPIYFDGMCKKVTRKILANSSKYVDNKEKLSKMFYERCSWITSSKKRFEATRSQGIFITTSGMVAGGPVLSYLDELWHDEKNKLFLMGFQGAHTNGRNLLEHGFYYGANGKVRVKMQIEKFDFSGHAGFKGLKKLSSHVGAKDIIYQHGDVDGVNAMKAWAEKEFPASKVHVPRVGDTISF